MCRNIHQLFNFDPVATDEEVHSAALQYVRKVSGQGPPSHINEAVFERAGGPESPAGVRQLGHAGMRRLA